MASSQTASTQTLLVNSWQSISNALGVSFTRERCSVSLAFKRRMQDRFPTHFWINQRSQHRYRWRIVQHRQGPLIWCGRFRQRSVGFGNSPPVSTHPLLWWGIHFRGDQHTSPPGFHTRTERASLSATFPFLRQLARRIKPSCGFCGSCHPVAILF
jgi:hypothetical protein